MTVYVLGVATQAALTVLAVVAALVIRRERARNVAAGCLTVALGVAGTVTGAAALAGHHGEILLRTPLDGLTIGLTATPLGGIFTLVAGAVGGVCALFAIGYARGPAASRTAWTAFAVFLLGLQLVPSAGDVMAFLLAWEAMAIGSTVLVLAEHRARPGVRPAGLWYAAMTHLSFLLVLAGLGILAAQAGSTRFDVIAAHGVSGAPATWAFGLLVLGFGAKAGVVPLHVWLPRAHPEAPSHVSALMSAAMVKMGIYGVLLTVVILLPSGPSWWGLVLLAMALPSALYGILQASVASDLKKLLAYSTTENVGLILAAISLAVLLRGTARESVAQTALVAALLLTVSHAAFKTTLFLSAGAIEHATGERDLDRLGGLAARMPVTTTTLGIGSLGAAALPVTSGFVAEWALLQALIHAGDRGDRLTTALLPVVIGVVALTAGLCLLTFVKAFGIATLARPRTDAAAGAHEGTPTMRLAQGLAAAAVLVLGLVPGLLVSGFHRVLTGQGARSTGLLGLSLPGLDASLNPVSLTLVGLVATAPIVVAVVVLGRRTPRHRVDLVWGGGGVRTSPRMQYTATSYAEPLVRVFDDALAPTRDVTVTHAEESRYSVQAIAYTHQVTDVVEARVYAPVVTALNRMGDIARAVQNGSIHRYMAFSFAALLLVLGGVLR